jgi:RNA polymerase sigma factor (sigma-70 family)
MVLTKDRRPGKLKLRDTGAYKRISGRKKLNGENLVHASSGGWMVYDPAVEGSPERVFSVSYNPEAIERTLSGVPGGEEVILASFKQGGSEIPVDGRIISNTLITGCLPSFQFFSGKRFRNEDYIKALQEADRPKFLDEPFMWGLEMEDATAVNRRTLTPKEEKQGFLHRDGLWLATGNFLGNYLQGGQYARDGLERHLKEIRGVNDVLIRANMPLVFAMYGKYGYKGNFSEEMDDFLEEGRLGLMRAVQSFDVSRGFKLSTYACRAIIKAFHRFGCKLGRREKMEIFMDPELDLEEGNFEEDSRRIKGEGLAEDLVDLIDHRKGILDEREERVIELRYGFSNVGKKVTLKDIAEEFGMSSEMIRQIQRRAEGKLKEALLESIN